jgi:hypothetical protein
VGDPDGREVEHGKTGRSVTERMRTDRPVEPVSSGLFTEVALF